MSDEICHVTGIGFVPIASPGMATEVRAQKKRRLNVEKLLHSCYYDTLGMLEQATCSNRKLEKMATIISKVFYGSVIQSRDTSGRKIFHLDFTGKYVVTGDNLATIVGRSQPVLVKCTRAGMLDLDCRLHCWESNCVLFRLE